MSRGRNINTPVPRSFQAVWSLPKAMLETQQTYRVSWTGEIKMKLFTLAQCAMVVRNQTLLTTLRIVKHGDGSIMLWGYFLRLRQERWRLKGAKNTIEKRKDEKKDGGGSVRG